jgi:hypothetical protein
MKYRVEVVMSYWDTIEVEANSESEAKYYAFNLFDEKLLDFFGRLENKRHNSPAKNCVRTRSRSFSNSGPTSRSAFKF